MLGIMAKELTGLSLSCIQQSRLFQDHNSMCSQVCKLIGQNYQGLLESACELAEPKIQDLEALR